MGLLNEQGEAVPTQPIDEVIEATSITGAKILGVAADGSTKLFEINDIKGDYKGLADPAYNPGTPVLQQKYDLKVGVTYPFLSGISVPVKVGTKYVVSPQAIWNGTAWETNWSLVDEAPTPDITTVANPWTARAYTLKELCTYVINNISYLFQNSLAGNTSVPALPITEGIAVNNWVLLGLSKEGLLSTRNTKVARVFDTSDGHYFTDGTGKVMFAINVSGSKSLAYNVIDPITKEVVATINKAWLDNNTIKLNAIGNFSVVRPTYKTDGHYFTDGTGKLMAKMTASGLQANKFINKGGEEIGAPPKKLTGKFVASLGDSHMNASWLSQFCTDTGSTYDPVMQPILVTNQVNYNDSGIMMGMAKALKQYVTDNPKTVDVILIENCHFTVSGAISDYVPMNYENLQVYGTIYGSYSAMMAAIAADKQAYIATLTPTLKTALRFRFSTFKETITFASATALTAGTITLTVDGVNFAISVTAGMTLIQAVTALNDWAFDDYLPNWSNLTTKGQSRPLSTIDLIYKGSSSSPAEPTITFNGGTTGMTMSTHALSSTTSNLDYYFNSLKLSEWSTMSKWISTNGTSAYPSMLGLIEYLQVNFPLAEIIVWSVQSLYISSNKTDANSFLVEKVAGSGTYYFDINAYYASADYIRYRACQIAMKDVSEKYSCRFLDVDIKCGISPLNMFVGGYFFSNNLHPTAVGYAQWGKTLAKLY